MPRKAIASRRRDVVPTGKTVPGKKRSPRAGSPVASPAPSDEICRWLLKSSIDGVFAFDRDLRFTIWNDSMERLSGISAREAVGRTAVELFPGVMQGSDSPFRQTLDGKAVFTTNAAFRRPGPSREMYSEGYFSPLRDGTGAVAGGIALIRDITGAHRTEEALKQSEERYFRLLEDSLTGNFLATPDGQLFACNPSFAAIFGFPSVEEAMGASLRSLFSEARAFDHLLERLRTARKLEYQEIELRRKDGESVYVIANFVGGFDDGGKLLELRGYLFDDTERKKLEEQLRQAQKMESIGTLAGGIAHDFNNLLNIVLSHATLVSRATGRERGPDSPPVEASLEAIRTAVDRGSGLVRQLLTFARETDAALARVDLNASVEEFLRMCVQTFPKAIAFDVSLAERLPPVTADRNQLHQALLNLCLNARDAMPQGGRLTIETGVSSGRVARRRGEGGGDHVFVRVGDDGAGMEDAARKRIFDPFFTTKEPGRGSGLGLAVVYGIVKSHSGFIEVESAPGRGSAFTLFFPAAPAGAVDEVPLAEEARLVTGGSETLLVVEDEELLLGAVRGLLEGEGYRVLEARDGLEALEVFDRHRSEIQVVVADLGLPRLGGWDLYLKLREDRTPPRIILTSGFVEGSLRGQMLDAGVSRILRKPYTAGEILQAIRGVVDGATGRAADVAPTVAV